MDANGQRFWMLAERAHWRVSGLAYDGDRRSLRLASTHTVENAAVRDARANEAAARARLLTTAMTRDEFETRAWWEASERAVRADGAIPSHNGDDMSVKLFDVAGNEEVTDVAIGYDGILYIVVGGEVLLRDLRDRWNPLRVRHDDLAAWRIAAALSGGMWVLDRTGALWRTRGAPFPARAFAPYTPDTLRPCAGENPEPPTITRIADAPVVVAGVGTAEAVAIATSPTGRVAILAWAPNGQAHVQLRSSNGDIERSMMLRGARFPYDIAWTSADTIAVLMTHLERAATNAESEAAVYPVDGNSAIADAVGDFYPLRNHDGGPFVNGVTLPPHYPIVGTRTAPLFPLSALLLAPSGTAEASNAMDSGSTDTVWHRLYLEAFIPPGTSIVVELAATNDATEDPAPENWHTHHFGAGDTEAAVPRGAWCSIPSELPFHRGLLDCPQERDRSGLYTVLIQRANRRVRTLRGRFLKVRVTLAGDGRSSPELAALRAYGSRFSYVEHYLPELYHEDEFGTRADEVLAPADRVATRPDFLERFLDNFEGMLTPLEDRIANAHLLTDPRHVPDASLSWLASWIGLAFDEAYPIAARRRVLANAPQLASEHGTLAGLRRALEIATDGAVSGGEIVIFEDYRLRRTFATILGVDLADETDPLLGALVDSGNSIVGDTLFLGDEHRKEFLALFEDDMPTSRGEDEAVDAIFERLAHRVTIMVHQSVSPQSLGLIRRIAQLEAPAHVAVRVVEARYAFMVGIASLVGVDSYLAPQEPQRPVRVDRTSLGRRDFLRRTASLDYRLV